MSSVFSLPPRSSTAQVSGGALNAGVANPAPAQAGQAAERPKSKFWVNIGIPYMGQDEEGNPIERQISLPVGIALDTMQPKVLKGNNRPEYVMEVQAQNALLAQLQEALSNQAPGTRVRLQGLTIEAYRVNEDSVEPNPEENPFMSLLAGLKIA